MRSERMGYGRFPSGPFRTTACGRSVPEARVSAVVVGPPRVGVILLNLYCSCFLYDPANGGEGGGTRVSICVATSCRVRSRDGRRRCKWKPSGARPLDESDLASRSSCAHQVPRVRSDHHQIEALYLKLGCDVVVCFRSAHRRTPMKLPGSVVSHPSHGTAPCEEWGTRGFSAGTEGKRA
jgi:hypothetical protein